MVQHLRFGDLAPLMGFCAPVTSAMLRQQRQRPTHMPTLSLREAGLGPMQELIEAFFLCVPPRGEHALQAGAASGRELPTVIAHVLAQNVQRPVD